MRENDWDCVYNHYQKLQRNVIHLKFSLNFGNLKFKIPLTFGIQKFEPEFPNLKLRLSKIFQTFKLSTYQTFKLSKFHNSNFQTSKLSNFQTLNFQTCNFQTFKLSNFQTSKLSNFQTFNLSNF